MHPAGQEIAHAHAVDAAGAARDRLDLAVVVHACAVPGGGERVLEAEALGKEQQVVEVVAGAAQVVGADRGLEGQRVDRAQHARALPLAARRQEVVEPHADAHRDEPALGAAVDGDEEGQRAHEVRREALEGLLLAEGLADELEVEELEVAQAAVDELGRFRRRARGEVALLEEGDGGAPQSEVARHPRAGHAAADHDGVEARSVDSVESGHAISSRTDRSTWSGASAAIRGSSGGVTPDRTRMVASPHRLPIIMSVSTRSPTMTDSAAAQPRAASATSRMIGRGLAHDGLDLPVGHGLDGGDHAGAVGNLAALDGTGAVRDWSR